MPDGLTAGMLPCLNPLHGLYAYLVGTIGGSLATDAVFMSVHATGAMAVLVGFVNAVAINIVLGQLDDATGSHADAANRMMHAIGSFLNIAHWSLPTLLFSAVTLALILLLERTRIGALAMAVAVAGGSGLAVALRLFPDRRRARCPPRKPCPWARPSYSSHTEPCSSRPPHHRMSAADHPHRRARNRPSPSGSAARIGSAARFYANSRATRACCVRRGPRSSSRRSGRNRQAPHNPIRMIFARLPRTRGAFQAGYSRERMDRRSGWARPAMTKGKHEHDSPWPCSRSARQHALSGGPHWVRPVWSVRGGKHRRRVRRTRSLRRDTDECRRGPRRGVHRGRAA
ncbi:SulP family inorganic anion transporter [Leucobacter sp. Marseille-Q4368]|uniref:SulP family inorganic anion transporter n=1 Tax=Leucobacter manosquensis TaxID=2810611 RepID=A0ABS5M739_9MICO|nr:SulP family inorganic anion transporter [Leucobacter manosquensis]